MGKEHSEILRNLVEKHGVYEASKILGLSHVEVIMKSGIEIDNEMANTVLYDLLREKKIPIHYEEFEIYTDNMTGSFIWEGHLKNFLNERILVYATPFWDGENYIPIQSDFYRFTINNEEFEIDTMDDFNRVLDSRSIFDNIEDLLTWYKHFYLPKVHDMIIKKLLPFLRKKYVEPDIN